MIDNRMTPDEITASWDGEFRFVKAVGQKKGLRSPQIGALHAIMAHIEEDNPQSGIIVMPTGTGKTETMLSLMVANKCRKVFVVVPSDALRTQIADKFASLGLLPEIGVVPKSIIPPIVAKVDKTLTEEEWETTITNSNVIVTTMTLAADIPNETRLLLNESISYLLVDEAHHSEATTWNRFISGFSPRKVLLFTATPYRNDGQKLKGKIIFNFPLRKAQEQGYYQEINYLPVIEYTQSEADREIARVAVGQLKKDIDSGLNHILMARCKDKRRAKDVFKCYKDYFEYNPVVIYSGIPNEEQILDEIKKGKHKIIVCVNMLGEGYDLPQLKIAAIHDERQSLAVTLQFIGRFTRVSKSIGKASFVTNVAYPPIAEEINNLYQYDADWNSLLPRISEDAINKEQGLNDYINEFSGSLVKEFFLHDIRPALSAEIYITSTTTTSFSNWEKGLTNICNYDIRLSAQNNDMLVVVLGKTTNVLWGTVKNIKNLTWDIIVVYFDAFNKRVYLNSSIELSGKKFLSAIFADVNQLKGECVYRIFANILRLKLYNVGARLHHGKDISFQSYFGSSVEDGINELSQGRLLKNNLYGVGFRDGHKVSVGCSAKGKLWSHERSNLLYFRDWCNKMGSLIADNSIDTNIVLQNTLKYTHLSSYPRVQPIAIDWHYLIYEHATLLIKYGEDFVPFDDCQFEIDDNTVLGENIIMSIVSDKGTHKIVSSLVRNDNIECVYKLISSPNQRIFIFGNHELSAQEFFSDYVPTIFLADNSEIHGVNLLSPKSVPCLIPENHIIDIEWGGVNLHHESQKEAPYITDSIQYYFAKLMESKYEYVIDDDGAGEIADLIGLNVTKHTIEVSMFHLKYAIGGRVSDDINNLYQVCGQAQKSISWKYATGNKFFNHVLKRDQRKIKNGKSSSILKGAWSDILKLREQASNKKELIFKIYVVQPGMSKSSATDSMKLLLGNTYKYLQETANIEFNIICSK